MFADYDNDGDLDLLVGNHQETNVLWQNQLDDSKYLRVLVVGSGAGGSPRDGIGSRVELWDAAQTSLLAVREVQSASGYGSQPPAAIHFGLAAAWGGGQGLYTVVVRFVSRAVVTATNIVPEAESVTVGTTVLTNTIQVLE